MVYIDQSFKYAFQYFRLKISMEKVNHYKIIQYFFSFAAYQTRNYKLNCKLFLLHDYFFLDIRPNLIEF